MRNHFIFLASSNNVISISPVMIFDMSCLIAEERSGGSWKRTITATRQPPIVPRSPVGGTNKPYVRPVLPPPPAEI